MPEETQAPVEPDQPVTPEDASPPEETSAEESFTDSYKPDDLPEEARAAYEKAYKDMQADYTRKTQEVSTQRQEAEQAQALVEALTDPNHPQHQEAKELVGWESPQEDDFEEPDPLSEVQQIKDYLLQKEQADEAKAQEAAEDDYLAEQLDALEKSEEREFDEKELQLLVGAAMAQRDGQGNPDLKGAYDLLKASQEAAYERYKTSKRAPQVPVGAAGSKTPDLSDDDVRQKFMADALEAEMQNE